MIKIGTPLVLEIKKDMEVERFRCKVVEYNENRIFVDYPINETTGRTGIFPVGTEFSASFVGQDNSVYRFFTEIIEKKMQNIPTLALNYPSNELIRIQRREYVRINTSVDTSVHDPDYEISPLTTVTQDISGGGISILIPGGVPFTQGKLLDVWIVLPMESGTYEYVYASSQIIRVIQRTDQRNDILSLKFINIKDKDRQSVIRYCFEKQLKERRRV